MNKFVKTVLIIAGICILIGVVLFICSYKFGNPEIFDDLKNEISEKYNVDVDISPSGISVSKKDGVISNVPGAANIYTVTDNINKIEINWVSGDILIQRGGDKITVEESREDGLELSEGQKMRIVSAGGELKINFDSNNIINIGTGYKKALIVTVPEKIEIDTLYVSSVSADANINGFALTEFESETTSGNVALEDITAKEASFEGTSGDLFVSGCTFDEFESETTSGNVVLEDTSAKEASFDGTSGDIFVSCCSFDEFELDSTSGNLRIDLTGITKEFKAESVSGDLRAVLTSTPHEIEIESTSGEISLGLPANDEVRFDVDSVSGDKKIEHDNIIKAVNVCKISTISGDIEVYGV